MEQGAAVRCNTPTTIGWKIDHNFSSKDMLSGVVNWMDFDNLTPGPIPDGPGASALGAPGVYDKVNVGETFIRNGNFIFLFVVVSGSVF